MTDGGAHAAPLRAGGHDRFEVDHHTDHHDDVDPLGVHDRSLGEIVGELTGDFSTLMHQEIALAKVEAKTWADMAKSELKEEAAKAGKGAGMLAGAGLAANLMLVFLSLTLMFVLENAVGIEFAALIVTIIWGAVAAVLGLSGKKKLQQVSPVPEQTVQTVKEDVEWQRNQIS